MKNIFSVDVEDYYQVEAFSQVIDRRNWNDYESRVENNTNVILDLLDEHKVKGTFFVLGCVAKDRPSIVRNIAERGHEVASHGMSHKMIYTQTPEEFRRETQESKKILEEIVQKNVNGYRAATYSITNKSLWALDILVEEGFKYDSSIFPMRHDKYGIPDVQRDPHIIETKSGKIVEIPIAIYEKMGFKIPCAGGGYFRLWPYWLTRWCLTGINKTREFNFYVHPWEIDTAQPRVSGASIFSRFRHYNNIDKCHNRLSKLLGDFSFSTAEELLTSKKLV